MTKEDFFVLLTEEVKGYKDFLETDSQGNYSAIAPL